MKQYEVIIVLQVIANDVKQAREFADGVAADINHDRPYGSEAYVKRSKNSKRNK